MESRRKAKACLNASGNVGRVHSKPVDELDVGGRCCIILGLYLSRISGLQRKPTGVNIRFMREKELLAALFSFVYL